MPAMKLLTSSKRILKESVYGIEYFLLYFLTNLLDLTSKSSNPQICYAPVLKIDDNSIPLVIHDHLEMI